MHHGFAQLAAMINNALGGKAQVADYMLGKPPTQHEEQDATLEDVLMLLTGKKK
ncbi:hypothetical protein [Denitromonas halophila]|uniref:hypothetical protein n=1 Tax=Denitromonas halophila TaxID=1629404 RepID=UPI001C9195C1|nr:hypothetical protein [Denitromonas halophila]